MADEGNKQQQDIIPVKAFLLQTCEDFFQNNKFDFEKYLYNRYDNNAPFTTKNSIPYHFTAQLEKPGDPDGYRLIFSYKDGIFLPAGRYISIQYYAGHISWLDCLVPLKTVSFDEAIEICTQIAKSFEKQGFKPQRLNTQLTEINFGDQTYGQWDTFGSWATEGDKPLEMAITIKSYNERPPAVFNMPLSKLEPKDTPVSYIISLDISPDFSCTRELIELEEARNLAVNGDEKKGVYLKMWFDDPDWRPKGWKGKWL